jgi:leader peptidase (prepilin peptidase) / N-methyltransferase
MLQNRKVFQIVHGYNKNMSFLFLFPALLGIIAALVVNYLADVLPVTLRLSRPVCSNPECREPFAWTDYLVLHRCRKCSKTRGWRTYLLLVLCVLSSVYLWFSHPAKLGFGLSLLVLTYFYVVALIDLEHHDVLRSLSVAGLALTGLTGLLMHGWLSTLLGGLAGFAIMYFFYLFGKLFTRLRARRLGQDPREAEEALGSGDVTLATILGLFLGWPLTWFGILLGVLFAGFISLVIILVLVIARKYRQNVLMVFIPFGPAFILSTVLLVYLPNWIGKALSG